MRLAVALLLIFASPLCADEARLHNTAAMAYVYDNKDKQAFDEFVLSLKADPNQAMPHFQLGRMFEKQGQFDEALKQYQDALTVDANFTGASEGVKRLGYLVAPRPTGAAAAAASDVLASGDFQRQLETAKQMTALRRFVEAEKLTTGLLNQKPGNPALCVLLAQDLEGQGRVGEALRWYREAQKRVPQSVQLQLAIAKLMYAQGDFNGALAEARVALQLDAKNSLTFRTIGEILLAADRKADAYQYLAEAARLNPGDALSKYRSEALVKDLGLRHYNNGMYFWQTGQWQRAVTELEAALKFEFGKLADEDKSRLQSALIDARFMLEKVGEKIAEIQKERGIRDFGVVDKRLSFDDVMRNPTFWREGRTVDFTGFLVAKEDGPIGSTCIVSTDRNEIFGSTQGDDIIGRRRDDVEQLPSFQGGFGGANITRGVTFRANASMERWFTFRTPKLLPQDDRIRPSSDIRVIGKLGRPEFIQNPYNHAASRYGQPVVLCTAVEFRRESPALQIGASSSGTGGQGGTRGGQIDNSFPVQFDVDTPPGIAGPLKIDYLTIDEPLGARPIPVPSPLAGAPPGALPALPDLIPPAPTPAAYNSDPGYLRWNTSPGTSLKPGDPVLPGEATRQGFRTGGVR